MFNLPNSKIVSPAQLEEGHSPISFMSVQGASNIGNPPEDDSVVIRKVIAELVDCLDQSKELSFEMAVNILMLSRYDQACFISSENSAQFTGEIYEAVPQEDEDSGKVNFVWGKLIKIMIEYMEKSFEIAAVSKKTDIGEQGAQWKKEIACCLLAIAVELVFLDKGSSIKEEYKDRWSSIVKRNGGYFSKRFLMAVGAEGRVEGNTRNRFLLNHLFRNFYERGDRSFLEEREYLLKLLQYLSAVETKGLENFYFVKSTQKDDSSLGNDTSRASALFAPVVGSLSLLTCIVLFVWKKNYSDSDDYSILGVGIIGFILCFLTKYISEPGRMDAIKPKNVPSCGVLTRFFPCMTTTCSEGKKLKKDSGLQQEQTVCEESELFLLERNQGRPSITH